MKRALSVFTLAAACGGSSGPTPAPLPASSSPSPVTSTQVRRVSGPSFSPMSGAEAIRAFTPEVIAEETGGECSLVRTGGNGATMVTAAYPSRSAPRMQVSITFDSAGRVVRYSERRGISTIRSNPGMTEAQRDSVFALSLASVRSTTVSLDWAIDQALATNSGGGKPTTAVIGSVRDIETLERLGPPTARLARVRTLCGV